MQYVMAPVAARVAELVGDDRVRVLENTRFNPGETKNDEGFARELADGCDLYVTTRSAPRIARTARPRRRAAAAGVRRTAAAQRARASRPAAR